MSKKLLTTLSLIVLAAMILSACGTGTPTASATPEIVLPSPTATEAPIATEAPTEPPATEAPTEEPVLGMALTGNKMVCELKSGEMIIIDLSQALKTEIAMPGDVKGCAIPIVNFRNYGDQWGYADLSDIGTPEKPILFIKVNDSLEKPALNVRNTNTGVVIVREDWVLAKEESGLFDIMEVATALDDGRVFVLEGAKSPVYLPKEYKVVPAN